ncbi:MAG: hypothetical protein KME64_00095 [Scytonematopsis contorta HA4267-MV1]|nr:hypothetical protein [Scytonematopsis contorta HA4267-MV1]
MFGNTSKTLLFISIRLYSCLVLVYPASFRREYGIEVIIVFGDMAKYAMRRRGFWGLLSVWSIVLPELWFTAREQHLLAGSYFRFRRIRDRLLQAFFSLIVLVFGFVYLLYFR